MSRHGHPPRLSMGTTDTDDSLETVSAEDSTAAATMMFHRRTPSAPAPRASAQYPTTNLGHTYVPHTQYNRQYTARYPLASFYSSSYSGNVSQPLNNFDPFDTAATSSGILPHTVHQGQSQSLRWDQTAQGDFQGQHVLERMQAQSASSQQPSLASNVHTYARASDRGYPSFAYTQQPPETQNYTGNYHQQFGGLPGQAGQSWRAPQTFDSTTPTDSIETHHNDDSFPRRAHRRATRTSNNVTLTQGSPLAQASTPTKVVKRKTNEDRVTRKPAPPRKSKIVKDMSSLINYMDDNEAMALIQRRAGTGDPNAPRYLNQFHSKQAALDHLSRVNAAATSFILPAALLVAPGQFSASDKLTLQQLVMDAVATAPGEDTVPTYLQDDEDKQNFTEKNQYQFDIVQKRLADLQDGSACIYLFVQCLLDFHDGSKGVPYSDLDLSEYSQEDIDNGNLDSSRLVTKKGKYTLDLTLSMLQRATLLIDILTKYKWVAKDVLQNTNLLEMVAAPRQYLSTKLNNCNTAKTRQNRWNVDQAHRGVTGRKAKNEKANTNSEQQQQTTSADVVSSPAQTP